ncbi:putative calcium permeable stress-gated cation channel 1 transmembrane domain-containing protein [Helianthus annuus]|nr:putative calcium permeable stress-gated cation channel 1 transmembrane domain-containing protein [Helianthus annuus]
MERDFMGLNSKDLKVMVKDEAVDCLTNRPFNDRVYFPKWYLKGLRTSPATSGAFAGKFVNLDYRSYLLFLNWMPDALKMLELELIDHAGLDSVVYLRIYLLRYVGSYVKAYAFTHRRYSQSFC